MAISIPVISGLVKFERSHSIIITERIGTRYPPGILNPVMSGSTFRRNLITESATPKYTNKTEDDDSIARFLNSPVIAKTHPNEVYASTAMYGVANFG